MREAFVPRGPEGCEALPQRVRKRGRRQTNGNTVESAEPGSAETAAAGVALFVACTSDAIDRSLGPDSQTQIAATSTDSPDISIFGSSPVQYECMQYQPSHICMLTSLCMISDLDHTADVQLHACTWHNNSFLVC